MFSKARANWISLCLITAWGCPGASPQTETPGPGEAAGSDATQFADGGAAGSGSDETSSDAGPPIGLLPSVDAGPTTYSGDASEPNCGASSIAAEQVVVDTVVEVPEQVTETVTDYVTDYVTVTKPVSLYIMFDQSASMAAKLWTPATAALKTFVNDKDSAGTRVALQYFPVKGGDCSGTKYDSPEVSLGVLPDQAPAISDSLAMHRATGGSTPIEGALNGATSFCKSYQAAHADEQCVAVLVTDGEPCTGSCACNGNFADLAAIAGAAKADGVTTFAVGLKGANFTLLDQIAQQGGAPDCDGSDHYACDVSQDTNKLSDALNSIRQRVVHEETKAVMRPVTKTITHTEIVKQLHKTPLECTWAIPHSDGGEEFDRNKVNIQFTSGSSVSTFVRVSSKDECVVNGWYFDDANAPTSFVACQQTCDAITAAEDGKVDILLGCATVVPG